MKILMFVYVKARRFEQGWIGGKQRRIESEWELFCPPLVIGKYSNIVQYAHHTNTVKSDKKTSGITPMFEIVILYIEFVMYLSVGLMEMTMSFSTQLD
jgi:hypothetical protein